MKTTELDQVSWYKWSSAEDKSLYYCDNPVLFRTITLRELAYKIPRFQALPLGRFVIVSRL